MKTGTSSLNPYAASYIPISRRGTADANKDYSLTENAYKRGDATVGRDLTLRIRPRTSTKAKFLKTTLPMVPWLMRNTHRRETLYTDLMVHHHKPTKEMMEIPEEEREMDLAYLQMMFPGISYESLSDVYFVNKGDLEATLDMLNHFEQDMDDYSENLLQSLDISDVSEYGSSTECASLKLKKVAGEVAGTSSGSSESAPIT
ncbi:LOW QUALITY PROTEIN: polyadenylate-binding protein-interacting protein 5-like [Actinidia eriantha]|uniref:LOW QUALITY PROTEIN: polyadenylate-binding protein-interacting protein 5-like n=1 Tax=Actinidia eriantha TaxID=165200 RepID=UPI00258C4B48|nr:LOW QUALITY PROTEIN: polyadenylate-binding protein-interacting protein 5-like [Actinidia eriantha]